MGDCKIASALRCVRSDDQNIINYHDGGTESKKCFGKLFKELHSNF